MFNLPNKWSPLKSVVLGRSYAEEFYKPVRNSKIRSCLQQIATETEEDYQYFEEQLKSAGVTVHRPVLDSSDSIENYVDINGKIRTNWQIKNNKEVNEQTNDQNVYVSNTLIPKPPMTPRDSWTVVGNTMLQTCIDHPSTELLIQNLANGNKIVDCWKTFNNDLPGGNIFQVGKDIYYSHPQLPIQDQKLITDYFSEYRWNFLNICGHADGVFHPICPGAIISLHDIQTYSNTFPGWDVLYLPNQSWDLVRPFLSLKGKNAGKWWLPGQEENSEFTNFVETWLNNWVGFVEETVFDVNCLVLDEHHIFVNNYNKEVFDFLKKHKMEPIIIPFRHRYFWDGGLHCITLDIERQGSVVDYFPNRP